MSSPTKYSALLPLMEHFYTVQGEGFHQGKASYLIRLGGCDIGCVWCDVKDSWDANAHPPRLEVMRWSWSGVSGSDAQCERMDAASAAMTGH